MYGQGHGHFGEHLGRTCPEVLRSLDIRLVHLLEGVVDRINHKRQEVVNHTEDECSLPQRQPQEVEKRDCGKGADEHIYPHRQDEEHHGHLGTVEFRIAQYPIRRIAQQQAEHSRNQRHLNGIRKGVQILGSGEEALEVREGEGS